MLELHKIKEAGQALQEAGVRDPGNPEIELSGLDICCSAKKAIRHQNVLLAPSDVVTTCRR